MGLSIAALKQGQERIHTVTLDTLDGETVRIREIASKPLADIVSKRDDEGVMTDEAVLELLAATITDEENGNLSVEDAKVIVEKQQPTIMAEIVEKIIQIHQGTESGND